MEQLTKITIAGLISLVGLTLSVGATTLHSNGVISMEELLIVLTLLLVISAATPYLLVYYIEKLR